MADASEGGDVLAGLRKRSVVLAGHATSLALEPEFWSALEALASVRSLSLAGLLAAIDASRAARPLASACRVAALEFALDQGTLAGHGSDQ